MTYNPQKHNRRSIRLKNYNYSQKGQYFITICCQNRSHLLGQIREGKLEKSEAGSMVEKWYQHLETKFEDIECGPYVVMPNHFHGIIINNGEIAIKQNIHRGEVGVNQSVYPEEPTKNKEEKSPETNSQKEKKKEMKPTQLSTAIQWFKTMTTNEYIRGVRQLGWKPFKKKVWQRNYWEHIIRSEEAYQKIVKYIQENPQNWQNDRLK